MKEIKQAVILAGGQGTRLRPLTLTTPKPMISIHGKPFLEYVIHHLKKNGVKKILLLTGYKHEKIEEYFGDGKKFGISIAYSKSPIGDDTGTRLKKAKKYLEDTFFLLYADNFWPQNLNVLLKTYRNSRKEGLMTVYSNFDQYTNNNILVKDGIVEKYDKTKKNRNLNGVDIGFFILRKVTLDKVPVTNFPLEVLIQRLIKRKQLVAYTTHHKYYGLSNLERIKDIENFFTRKKVVFLDRDGVINQKQKKAHYVISWEDFKFLPHVKSAFKLLQKKGYIIFIVTNQPGVARKMVTERGLEEIHKKMLEEFKKIGVDIKEIFVCKHGWDEGCFCRKPNPGMFFQAQKHGINLLESYCIGDDERDIIAGQLAGCKTFLVDNTQDLYAIVKKYL